MKNYTYNTEEIEKKWQKYWEEQKTFAPDLESAKKPYYNLMMFPYPSAEGLHVGNMYAQTGADVYGRFKRQQGYDVFEPMGLDGFGIHSENYALKIGKNPMEQAKVSQDRFYKQMKAIGTSIDWSRTLETYDPLYYRWTQWLFIKLFKAGLAYRKKAEVNWCPSCKTVLSDEQVLQISKFKVQNSKSGKEEKIEIKVGICERCSTEVEKKDLEQWFFKITDYAERLLANIEKLDWTEKVKIAQANWIGKSTGALIDFPIDKKYRFINLHGFTGSPDKNFFPWLEAELKKQGHEVYTPHLPESEKGSVEKQVQYVLEKYCFDTDTVLLGHSLGSAVALKILEKLDVPIRKLVLVAGFAEPGFLDHEREFEKTFDFKFDFKKIKENAGEVVLLRASNDTAVPQERSNFIQSVIGGTIIDFKAKDDHVTGDIEPEVLQQIVPVIKVFTTRPDTLYGATFLVVAPEHELLKNSEDEKVNEYIKLSKNKSNQEREDDGKEKTGVFSGLYAINPVTHKKIPVWVADYVLSGYGTGAIMAVPAHDTRDFAFAKKFDLEIIEVIENRASQFDSKIASSQASRNDSEAYIGSGKIINSGEWDGWPTPESIGKVIAWLEKHGIGRSFSNYHLRDWLISRQRYWGPPIPMVYCQNCATKGKSWFSTKEAASIHNSEFKIQNSVPGWYPVSEQDLPVLLPDVEDWKPMGTGKSPLANHPEFYNVKCPECGEAAMRETDVSDTFLDSAWYNLRYLATDWDDMPFPSVEYAKSQKSKATDQNEIENWKMKIENSAKRAKWLPVTKYIGGAEHSVLHLLYARFISMVLHDLKLIDFDEPFSSFFAHGLIIKDGAKMSKSKGNVVIPDEYIKKYGADTLRSYLMFLGPFSDGGDFRDSGIEGMNRFIKRVWRLLTENLGDVKMSSEGYQMMHKTIKKVTEDISLFKYNTAIASLMEWYNFLSVHKTVSKIEAETFLKLLAPFAPFMTEELYQNLEFRIQNSKYGIEKTEDGRQNSEFKSIHLSLWPEFDEKYLVSDEVTVVIQVNGKKRGELRIQNSELRSKNDELEKLAKQEIKNYLENQEIKKVIHVPGKIINFVV